MLRTKGALSLAFIALTLSSSGAASAQGPSSNEAAAEALFNEGRTLVESGHVDEGCKKLEASQTLDPGTGTLLHLADCYEKLGRTATAWARFREAASRAARDGRADWETIAKTRSAELEPKLARLRIDAPRGITVKRDGDDIPAAALGSALPIDPGEHALSASAPGKKPWSSQVNAVSASLATVVVPALEDDPAARTADAAPPLAGGSGSSLRTVGYAAGAVGLIGLAVGTISGLSAISLNRRSKDVCPMSGVCADDAARSDNDSARSAATVSTIGFVAGGALLAGGLALVLFAPSSTSSAPPPATARLRVSPQALWLEGMW